MITCHFCPLTVGTVEDAVLSGWTPGFWDEATRSESDTPVCPACVDRCLVWNRAYLDYEPKPEFYSIVEGQ